MPARDRLTRFATELLMLTAQPQTSVGSGSVDQHTSAAGSTVNLDCVPGIRLSGNVEVIRGKVGSGLEEHLHEIQQVSRHLRGGVAGAVVLSDNLMTTYGGLTISMQGEQQSSMKIGNMQPAPLWRCGPMGPAHAKHTSPHYTASLVGTLHNSGGRIVGNTFPNGWVMAVGDTCCTSGTYCM